MNTALGDDTRQLVVFIIDGEKFGVDILKVQEIIKTRDITFLPDMADFVEGIIELRGEVIPVCDLRKRFGVDPENDRKSRIVIVDIDGRIVGLIVDRVEEVVTVKKEILKEVDTKLGQRTADYVDRVAAFEDTMIIILHLDTLLSTEEKIKIEDIRESV